MNPVTDWHISPICNIDQITNMIYWEFQYIIFCFTDPGVLVNSLPASIYQDLGKLLNPAQQYKDWQTLAGKMGYTQTDIENWKLRSTNDFTETVLMDWCTRKPNATVRDLYKILVEIPREDAVSVLYNIDKSTSIHSEVTV